MLCACAVSAVAGDSREGGLAVCPEGTTSSSCLCFRLLLFMLYLFKLHV